MRRFLVGTIILLSLLPAAAPVARADALSDLVAAVSSAFGFMADEDTGLTMFPLLTMSMGGRADGMAGAVTAFGGGAEGLDANPAGSALMSGGSLFLSHRSGIADSSIEGAAAAGRSGPFGFGAYAKVFLAPFTRYDDSGVREGSGYFSESVFAGTLALQLLALPGDGGIAAGANLKTAVRLVPDTIAPGESALAFALDVGLLARARLPSLSSDGPANFGAGAVLRNITVKAIPAGFPLPTLLSLGVAYAPLNPLTLDVDVNVPVRLDGSSVPVEQVDAAVGLEARVSSFAAVLAGFHLKGDSPRLTLGARLAIGQLDLTVSYGLDLAGGVNPLSNYSVAAAFSPGS